MRTVIDINKWERKEVFQYFSKFQNPYGGLTAPVDVTKIYKEAQLNHRSFYLSTLHRILYIINHEKDMECFRMKIEGNEVVMYDEIDVGPTYLREDHTLSFMYYKYYDDIDLFIQEARKKEEEGKLTKGLNFQQDNYNPNLLYFTCVPWISYTQIIEPKYSPGDSNPHISTGKYYWEGDKLMMPVTVCIHHGFGDGYHISKFLNLLAGE
jgi:chloramphenicol O-acetyltransferase type A